MVPSPSPPIQAEQVKDKRLAWMGVELRALGSELAQANGVSHLTDNGASGALVADVYLGSPAEGAGITPGLILLDLQADDNPQPLKVKVSADDSGFMSSLLDRLGEEDMQGEIVLPRPWPPANNSVTRLLTDWGIGAHYRARFFYNGGTITKDLIVAPSPPHYDSAASYRSEVLGLSVRDLTYEVRRHFQRTEDDPGVIISQVDPDGRAAAAGLQLYEVVSHVNGQAVATVKGFERLIANQRQLRLFIQRMARSRLVRIDLSQPWPEPASDTEP